VCYGRRAYPPALGLAAEDLEVCLPPPALADVVLAILFFGHVVSMAGQRPNGLLTQSRVSLGYGYGYGLAPLSFQRNEMENRMAPGYMRVV
jgi:hypothetical protein